MGNEPRGRPDYAMAMSQVGTCDRFSICVESMSELRRAGDYCVGCDAVRAQAVHLVVPQVVARRQRSATITVLADATLNVEGLEPRGAAIPAGSEESTATASATR